MKESKSYLFFLSDQQKNTFLVCCRILVISSCLPWDKDWKLLLYYKVNWQHSMSMYQKIWNWYTVYKNTTQPWLMWLSGLSAGLRAKGSPVQLPVRAHAWVAGQVPSRGRTGGSHTDVSLPLFLPSALKITKIFLKTTMQPLNIIKQWYREISKT